MSDEPKSATALWVKYRRKPDKKVRDALVAAYVPWVHEIVDRLVEQRRLSPSLADDYFADGLLGLQRAVEKFSPRHQCRFKSYLERRVKWSILDGVRARDWCPRRLRDAGKAPVQVSLDNVAAVADRRSQQAADEVDRHDLFASLETNLSPIERQVFRLRYAEELTYGEIGTRLGMSEWSAFKHHKTLLGKLRTSHVRDVLESEIGARRTQ